jgi:hypothetical protein
MEVPDMDGSGSGGGLPVGSSLSTMQSEGGQSSRREADVSERLSSEFSHDTEQRLDVAGGSMDAIDKAQDETRADLANVAFLSGQLATAPNQGTF